MIKGSHFNPNDPAHCDECFKEGERRIRAAGSAARADERNEIDTQSKKLRMAKADLRSDMR